MEKMPNEHFIETLFKIEKTGEAVLLTRFLGDQTIQEVKIPDGVTSFGKSRSGSAECLRSIAKRRKRQGVGTILGILPLDRWSVARPRVKGREGREI